jgi:4-amino-4-deoxy-L-arabinose transferase-like glycosyltransferase
VLYALILALAVFTRFYDLGARAVSHDESLHMLYSFKLFDGDGYRHDPMMHGPLLFEVNALLYFLFGDNNTVARSGVALFGVALVMLPYWFRPWLGRLGALVASGMMLISPVVTHYSRHLRHDVFNEVFTVLMFIALFQYLLAWREGSERRRSRWLYLGAAAVALMLCTKELAFIHGFIGLTFILVIGLMEGIDARRCRLLFVGGLVLLIVVGLVVLWLTFGNAPSLPGEETPTLARQVIDGLAGLSERLSNDPELTPESHVASIWMLIQMAVLLVGLLFAASTHHLLHQPIRGHLWHQGGVELLAESARRAAGQPAVVLLHDVAAALRVPAAGRGHGRRRVVPVAALACHPPGAD